MWRTCQKGKLRLSLLPREQRYVSSSWNGRRLDWRWKPGWTVIVGNCYDGVDNRWWWVWVASILDGCPQIGSDPIWYDPALKELYAAHTMSTEMFNQRHRHSIDLFRLHFKQQPLNESIQRPKFAAWVKYFQTKNVECEGLRGFVENYFKRKEFFPSPPKKQTNKYFKESK